MKKYPKSGRGQVLQFITIILMTATTSYQIALLGSQFLSSATDGLPNELITASNILILLGILATIVIVATLIVWVVYTGITTMRAYVAFIEEEEYKEMLKAKKSQ